MDEYIKEDEYAVYHDYEEERDLPIVKVKLPSVEDFYGEPWEEAIKNIDGYGLHPRDQHFENYRKLGYYDMPDKLKGLQDVVRVLLDKKDKEVVHPDEMFDELESRPSYYKREIEWIKLQQKRAYQGYWLFIKGKPTYLDGTHYIYLLYAPINNTYRSDRLPFYRDVDRRIFLYLRWAATTKSSNFKLEMVYRMNGELRTKYFNNIGVAQDWARVRGIDYSLEELDASTEVEMKNRTIFGVVFPKRRRIGGTSQLSVFGLVRVMQTPLGGMAIQALTEDTAKQDVYGKKIYPVYREMPFFYKPAADPADTNKLKFTAKRAGVYSHGIKPHGGWITPRSSDNKAFDGNEVTMYLNDEPGKKKKGDIYFEWSDTIKNMLGYGLNIKGFAGYVSTFGDFEKGGGREFFELCKASYPHIRDDNGQTLSGLSVLFISALDSYDGCIDMYGAAVIEDPVDPYINLEGETMEVGSRTVLKNQRDLKRRRKDWIGLTNETRSNPWCLREAAQPAINGDNIIDIAGLLEVKSELEFGAPKTRRVNLRWSDGKSIMDRPLRSDIYVVAEEDDNGIFEVYMNPLPGMDNLKQWNPTRNTWEPTMQTVDRFVLGTDPVEYDVKDLVAQGRKGVSKAAMLLYAKRDFDIDPEDKDMDEIITENAVMTYLHRPDLSNEYAEHVLLACVYWGTLVLSESNLTKVLSKFRDWKCDGYLMYMVDKMTGRVADVPGIRTNSRLHQDMFDVTHSFMKSHKRRVKFLNWINQVIDTQTFDEITKNDLFAAGAIALIGAQNSFSATMLKAQQSSFIPNVVQLYK